jgi:hypothetical protein
MHRQSITPRRIFASQGNELVRECLTMKLFLLSLLAIAGCSYGMDYDGPRGIFECTDFRDGEKYQFHTDTMRNIRSDGFNLTDLEGRAHHIGPETNVYLKCVLVSRD